MITIVSNELREITKMNYKICTKCKVSKLFVEFAKDKSTKDGINSQCKKCRKEYRLNNQEKFSKYCKEYKLNNKDKIKEKNKEYRLNNQEKFSKYFKEYRLNNKDKIKEYTLNNKDKKCKYLKEYSKKITLSLPDSYVLKSIKLQTSFPHNAEIPAELIEAKRLEIKIKRLLKDLKK